MRRLCLVLVALLGACQVAPPSGAGREGGRTLESLRRQVAQLELRVQRQEDVRAIETVAYSYAYYMDNALYDQAIALFSENTESCEIGGYGVYLGLEGCVRLFKDLIGKYYGGDRNLMDFGRLAKHYMVKPVVTVAADGRSATGRFDYFSFGGTFRRSEAGHQVGIYTMHFVKEDGVWKIGKFWVTFKASGFGRAGWHEEPERYYRCYSDEVPPDRPTTFYHPFPETAVVPFHYAHPVTGEEVEGYVNPKRYYQGHWPEDDGSRCGIRTE